MAKSRNVLLTLLCFSTIDLSREEKRPYHAQAPPRVEDT